LCFTTINEPADSFPSFLKMAMFSPSKRRTTFAQLSGILKQKHTWLKLIFFFEKYFSPETVVLFSFIPDYIESEEIACKSTN